MSFADQLTLARAAAVPIVIVLFVWDFPNHDYWATAVFAVAMATDWFDGRLARRSGRTSALGSLLDPVADKLLVLTVMILLVGEGVFPGWMVARSSPVSCSSRGCASRRSSAESSSTRATWGASRPGRRRSPRGSGAWLRPAPSTIRSLCWALAVALALTWISGLDYARLAPRLLRGDPTGGCCPGQPSRRSRRSRAARRAARRFRSRRPGLLRRTRAPARSAARSSGDGSGVISISIPAETKGSPTDPTMSGA